MPSTGLDEVVARWAELRAAIEVLSLAETADRYLEVLRA